jgi:DNA polymerase-3 subunit alpha
MFVHLHVHSEFSLQDSTLRIFRRNEGKENPGKDPGMAEQAKALGMTHLALTDHHALFGAFRFEQACKKHGIEPIFGVDLLVDGHPLVLLAETQDGYTNLVKLLSYANSTGKVNGVPGVTKPVLRQYARGLIALSGGVPGEVSQVLLSGGADVAASIVHGFVDIFGKDNFFLEITDHGTPEEAALRSLLPELSRLTGIPLVATNDVHYLLPEHNYARAVMRELSGETPPWERHTLFSDQFYLKSPEEMAELFRDLPEAVEITGEIAKRCEGVRIPRERALPEFPVPPGETIESYFEKVTWEGFYKRFPNPPQRYVDQLRYEIDTVKQMGFPDYFLIVWDFVKYAKENGIPVGPGRGSAAGALVSYSLGITELDPIANNLVFERFLNPHRVSMPDIDIDFCYEKRHLMLEYVTQKYGHDHVAQIVTFGTLGAKMAIKDVGRVLGIPYKLTDEMSKELGDIDSLEEAKQLAYFQQKLATDDQVKTLFEVGEIIEGLPRHTSVHAAGVVIARKPLLEYVPLQEVDGVVITQWDMEEVQEVGLLKMDFLGLKTLTVIERTLELVRRTKGIHLRMQDIPLDDPKTYELLRSGKTSRVFQLESGGMQKVLRELEPAGFQDVSAVLALYRPGPMQFIPQYIEGKRTGKWKVPHPLLKDILDETYGIIVYQEQIQMVAQRLAGYSLGEADILRRAVSKKKAEILAQERENFVNRAVAQGIDEQVASEVYDMIVLFADYGFNRAHSAAYAVISVMTAYLKAHFPVEFMAANLTVAIGDSKKLASILGECRRMGIDILPPDVRKSQPAFTVENGAIRYGLMGVRGIGEPLAKAIAEAAPRASTFEELLLAVPSHLYTRAAWENLIHAGALDAYGNRGTLLAHLGALLDFARERQEHRRRRQMTFFDLGVIGPAPLVYEPDPPHLELLREEKRVLEIILSGHPLDSCADLVKPVATAGLIDLDESFDGQQVVVAGVFSNVKTILTKKGQKMAFAALDDQTGEAEVVIFPKAYEASHRHLKVMTPVFVYGKVEWDRKEDRAKIICDRVRPILTGRQVIYITVRDEAHLERLKKAVSSQNGVTNVLVYRMDQKRLEPGGFSIRLNQDTLDVLASETYVLV